MPDILTRADRQMYELRMWRIDELERAGYPPDVASILADRRDVELHAACQLLKRGATLEQALSILL